MVDFPCASGPRGDVAAGVGEWRLLWIDDEKSPSDPDIFYLKRKGFYVDCALSGSAGLAMARTIRYHAILLDLRLPDLPGITVLAMLRAGGVEVPVLVLTGFGDFESARVAGTFGAAFKTKPLYIDDLEIALHDLIGRSPISHDLVQHVRPAAADRHRDEFASIGHLLEQLERAIVEDPVAAQHPDPCGALLSILLRAMANPALPMAAFLACAKNLKFLMQTSTSDSSYRPALCVQTLVLEAIGRASVTDARVARAIATLRYAAERDQRITLEALAASMGERIGATRLGSIIESVTGFYFTDWRTGFLLRPCLAPLLNTDENLKQLVSTREVFKDLSHFDHEFHRFFGLSPSELRRIWRSNSS